MSEKRILLDTNAYLKLGHSIYPLIHQKFGKTATYTLLIHPYLEDEVFKKSSRLDASGFKAKFHWFFDERYLQDRKLNFSLSKKDKKEIDFIVKTIRHSEEFESFQQVSDIDVWCLAFGMHFEIPVVTDDSDMFFLAKELEITVLTTLELLKLMLDEQHISIEKIREIASYWLYLPDIPRNFAAEYYKLFKENVPKL